MSLIFNGVNYSRAESRRIEPCLQHETGPSLIVEGPVLCYLLAACQIDNWIEQLLVRNHFTLSSSIQAWDGIIERSLKYVVVLSTGVARLLTESLIQ